MNSVSTLTKLGEACLMRLAKSSSQRLEAAFERILSHTARELSRDLPLRGGQWYYDLATPIQRVSARLEVAARRIVDAAISRGRREGWDGAVVQLVKQRLWAECKGEVGVHTHLLADKVGEATADALSARTGIPFYAVVGNASASFFVDITYLVRSWDIVWAHTTSPKRGVVFVHHPERNALACITLDKHPAPGGWHVGFALEWSREGVEAGEAMDIVRQDPRFCPEAEDDEEWIMDWVHEYDF